MFEVLIINSRKKILSAGVVCTLLLLAIGCASTVPQMKIPDNESEDPSKKRAMDLFIDGKVAESSKNYGDAIASYMEALQFDPEYVDAQVLLARSESKLRNLRKAMAADSAGSSEIEDEQKIRIKKHYIEGVAFYMNGLYQEAISEWEEVLRLDPANESVKTNIERARKRLEMMGVEG